MIELIDRLAKALELEIEDALRHYREPRAESRAALAAYNEALVAGPDDDPDVQLIAMKC